jgi:hypothetical protein
MERAMPSGTLERVEARVAGSVPDWFWSSAVKVVDMWDGALGELRFRLVELLAARKAQADPEAKARATAAIASAATGARKGTVLPSDLRDRWLQDHPA